MNLVVGGAGFLGRAVARLLIDQGEAVRVLDLRPSPDGVESHTGDLRDGELLKRALDGVTTVHHCASAFSQNPASRSRLEAVNVAGAQRLLDAARSAGVTGFAYTSSVDVLSDGTPISGAPPSWEPVARPLGVYAQTKAVAETLILGSDDPAGMRTCAIRPAGIWGPHDRLRMPQVLDAARQGMFVRIGDGSSLYSHVYVDNVAWAQILAARALPAGVVGGNAYAVTDSEPENFHAFLLPLVQHALGEAPVKTLPRPIALPVAWATEAAYTLFGRWLSGEPDLTRYTVGALSRDLWFTYERAKRDFGYEPLVSLDEARARTCAWLDTLANPEAA